MTKIVRSLTGTLWIVFGCLLMTSCVGTQPKYAGPHIAQNEKAISFDIESHYDDVWNRVIKSVARSSYAIKSHEKNSGLITLSFGLGEASKFVDCGYLESATTGNKGPYIEMVDSRLDGLMNVVVSKISPQKTNITANVRYLLNIKDGGLQQDWVFDAYGHQTKHIGAVDITCTSTGVAESYIKELIFSEK